MGREVRRVPPNWEHPKTDRRGEEGYRPIYDEYWDDAVAKWKEGFAKWEAGFRPGDYVGNGHYAWVPKMEWKSAIYADHPDLQYWEYVSPPPKDRDDYRPYRDAEATWFQLYETVSEGTPVSPPFATREELIEYLVANGDFWDQSRRKEGRTGGIPCGPWSRQAAESIVNGGFAPSMIVEKTTDKMIITSPGHEPEVVVK